MFLEYILSEMERAENFPPFCYLLNQNSQFFELEVGFFVVPAVVTPTASRENAAYNQNLKFLS